MVMTADRGPRRRSVRVAHFLPILLAGALGACSNSAGLGPAIPGGTLSAPTTPVESGPLDSANTIGTGPVRIGLILPLTQGSGPSVVGVSLRNAAELALSEAGSADVTILIKDDQSTPDGARTATQAALGEGADLILGPLYANNVREAGRLGRGANKPVIAFSTDTSVASRGIYLLSFLVESYVSRIVDFASSKGKKSFAALVPENDYGNVALAEFQEAVARRGGRVQAIERYAPGNAAAAIGRIAGIQSQIDALFIPEQADAMTTVAAQLKTANIDTKKVQILGTGLWNDARVLRLAGLQGAWFSAPENGGFNAFAQRYRAKFNSDPTRIATLAYDAVSLAAALARTQGTQRFSEGVLTNSSGFNGADGVFRFRADGQNDRGLSILQINNGTTTVVSPAPRSFGGGAG